MKLVLKIGGIKRIDGRAAGGLKGGLKMGGLKGFNGSDAIGGSSLLKKLNKAEEKEEKKTVGNEDEKPMTQEK